MANNQNGRDGIIGDVFRTEQAIAKEKALIERVAPIWGEVVKKNPEWHKIDFSVVDHSAKTIIGFVEAKCRNCNHATYRTFFISLTKYMSACEIAKFTGIPTYILVEWLDQTKYVKVPCRTTDVCMEGRLDRGNPNDQEPMIHIPIAEFRPIEEVPTFSSYLPNDLNSSEVPHIDWDDDF
jgi:hypothetical protein